MSTIRDLVAEYLGIAAQRGDEWLIHCPDPDHNDSKPSATIYVGEPMERLRGGSVVRRTPGLWHCFSCGAAGKISNDAIENYTPTTDRNIEVFDQVWAELADTHVQLPEAWLDLYAYPGGVHPYWLSRMSESTAVAWRMGYDPERNAGTYPLRSPDGRLLGVVHRSFDTEATGWKYRYPPGVEKNELLFGHHEVDQAWIDATSRVLAVCEGALDAIACWEAGVAAVAILGSRISPAQVRLLNRLCPTTVLVCFDNDEAGRGAEAGLLRAGIECLDVRRVELGTAKDIAELGIAERTQALARAPMIDLYASDHS